MLNVEFAGLSDSLVCFDRWFIIACLRRERNERGKLHHFIEVYVKMYVLDDYCIENYQKVRFGIDFLM